MEAGQGPVHDRATAATPKTSLSCRTSSTSRINTECISHHWTIENFTKCQFFQSGTFFSEEFPKDSPLVRLKLRLDLTKDYASICVVPVHGMQGRNCVYTLTLLGEAGRPVQRYFHNGFHTLYRGSTNYLGIELCKAFLYNRENKCIHGDALSILFEVEFLANSTNTPIKRTDIPVSPLLKNLAGLLEDKSFGNVQLTVQQRNLYAHRDVLMLSSPVFGAMFSHPTKESQEQVIHLPDQSFDAMREMLLFIYTGEVPNLDKVAEDLYVAADKYSMSELKTLCGDYLGSNLTVERAADAFVLSNMYSDAELSQSIARFIADHLVAVQRTAGWKNIWGKPDITERLFMLIADIGNTLESAT
ncbi:speckle-type POZ protein-like [Dermacentor variabilis]|uniref:speckle-type POZ protein-like n=1 Tax=Dermacentor variabilis TaxID=34621 RepID=UPI003F5BC59B